MTRQPNLLIRLLALLIAFALSAAFAPRPAAQQPAAELVSLLDTGFFEQNGRFMADKLCLVFPPDADARFELVVRDRAGGVKGSAQLQVERWSGMAAFDGLGSLGVPILAVEEAGEFVLSVDMNGEPITSIPFTMEVASSGDPFNPRTTYTREGPWRRLAFLTSPTSSTGRPDRALEFHFWSNEREIPKAGSANAKASVRVMLGDEVVACYKDSVSIHGTKWRRHRRQLVVPSGDGEARGNTAFTLERLRARDGAYSVVVEANGESVKRFTLEVRDGELVPLGRASFGTEPHTDYIVPKWIDRSSGSTGGFVQHDAFWLEAN